MPRATDQLHRTTETHYSGLLSSNEVGLRHFQDADEINLLSYEIP